MDQPVVERPPVEQEHEKDSFSPQGTLLFVLLMLLGYAAYWGYLWFIVVIQRAGGGA